MKPKKYYAILILILSLMLVAMLMLPALVPKTGEGGSKKQSDTPDKDSEKTQQTDVLPVSETAAGVGSSLEEGLAGQEAETKDILAGEETDTNDGLTGQGAETKDIFAGEETEALFSKEPLSNEIKKKITGVSYHENDTITYDDLNLLRISYYDFEGKIQHGELFCNKSIADDLLEIFTGLYDAQYQLEKVRLIDEYGGDDDLSCADNNTSCFNYRVVAGSNHLSNHAKGLAVDINPFYNPYITHPDGGTRISPEGSEPYADRSNIRPHMIDENDLCYKLFTEHGFTWGGHWKSVKDYQHFEKP